MPEFLSLDEVWRSFGALDPSTGQRFVEFVAAGLQETFANTLLHGSERLAGLVAPLLKPHQHTRQYVYAHPYAGRPSVGVLFDGCVTQWRSTALRTRHSSTMQTRWKRLAPLWGPSVICRWIQRASRRKRASLPEDSRAMNKI